MWAELFLKCSMRQKKSVLLSSKPLPEVLACITASLTQRGCALCLLGCEQGGWLRMMTFYKSHGLKPLKLVASRRPVLWGDRCTAAFTSTSTVTIFIFNSVLLLFSLVWIYCAETSDASVVDSNFARSGVKRNDCVMRRGVTEKQQHITTTRTEWKKKNDGGEQERAPSREREGRGEAAPAARVRPQRTSQDRAGLRGDAGVPVGEFAMRN